MTLNRTIRTASDWATFAAWLGDHPSPYPFRISEGEGRSISQNATLHWFLGQIANQRQDMSAAQVKGELHREIGLAIRLRNPGFAWVWDQTGAQMDYERQCRFLASGVLNVSSGMTTTELREYLDAIKAKAAEAGWALTEPRQQ